MIGNPFMIPSDLTDAWLRKKGNSHRASGISIKTAEELGREALEETAEKDPERRRLLAEGGLVEIDNQLHETYFYAYYYGWLCNLGREDATAGNTKRTAEELERYAAENGFGNQKELQQELNGTWLRDRTSFTEYSHAYTMRKLYMQS